MSLGPPVFDHGIKIQWLPWPEPKRCAVFPPSTDCVEYGPPVGCVTCSLAYGLEGEGGR